MKNVRIIALHLAYGGVEKAIISTANLLCRRYNVEIISVYDMPGGPAFPLDSRVKVRYLLSDTPNREQWRAALSEKKPGAFIKESARAVKILSDKKRAVRESIKEIHDGAIICTRHEDNMVLSKYGDKNVLKIAQFHEDHGFNERLLRDFKENYGNIDVFTLLSPVLVDELRELMKDNKHTRLCWVPNFLESFPGQVDFEAKEKTILAVGRLDRVKGFDRLIRCFKTVHGAEPDWQLKIAGSGEQEAQLRELIEALGLSDSVSLLGRLSADRVEEEMKKASVYAMSSHREGFAIVLLEAGSCGLPSVTFDVRVGPATVLKPGEDSLFVPDGDEQAYSEALLRLIREPALREKMGRRAMENVRRFSAESLYGIWTDIIGD